jgi:phosphoribosylformylglycinamidine (FGAM) synthase PurS component
MLWRVDVATRDGLVDPASRGALSALREYGLAEVQDVRAEQVYLLEGDLDRAAADRVARELLHDPVAQTYALRPAADPPEVPAGLRAVLVFKRPGVMDPVEASALKAIADLGLSASRVRTGMRYLVRGPVPEARLREAAARVLANEAVDELHVGERRFERIALGAPYRFRRVEVPLTGASDEELLALSRRMGLSLNLSEMQAVRRYFRDLRREPTDVELETLAQTWSEHCKHKTFTGDIRFGGETIRNLLKSPASSSSMRSTTFASRSKPTTTRAPSSPTAAPIRAWAA